MFRLLQTLESLGFLERADKDRNYRLGVAVLRLGFEYLSSLELTDLGLPIIEALRDETGLTSHIVIRDGRDVVFVAKAQSHEPIFSSVKVNVGTRLPAHATTHGQVLMGDLTLDESEDALSRAGTRSATRSRRRSPSTSCTNGFATTPKRGYADQRVVVRARHFGGERRRCATTRARIVAVDHDDDSASEIDAPLLDSGLVDKVRRAADELSQRLNYRAATGRPEARAAIT